MANLRELRKKLSSIKSTRKLTAAMKLVAGVKLKKSEQKVFSSRPYFDELSEIISGIRWDIWGENPPELLFGRENVETVLLVVFFADKGLCGNFNYSMLKGAQEAVNKIHEENKKVHIICFCQKGYDNLKHLIKEGDFLEILSSDLPQRTFEWSDFVAKYIIDLFTSKKIDQIDVLYSKYLSAIHKEVIKENVVPHKQNTPTQTDSIPIFEPNVPEFLNYVLEQSISNTIYQTALESFVSEQSSRMMAMDNATKNADDMISALNIRYNRLRQSIITLELVEIISGAEALNEGKS